MDWKDEGLIIGVRRHGETSAIIELMTPGHGRHLGLVRGGRSARMRPVLQPGNSVTATWRARLEEHLGTFTVEANKLRVAELMQRSAGIYGIQTLANHLRLLPERDPHKNLYNASLILVEHFDQPEIAATLLVKFEIALLEELGFGLDLTQCAASGVTSDLGWVSPKSGRAVSRGAGKPWEDKLLALPEFLQQSSQLTIDAQFEFPTPEDVEAGFALSSYFLEHHIYHPRGIRPPDERQGFIRAAKKAAQTGVAPQS